MVNYYNGKIYRLVCKDTGEVYIGSTVCALNLRYNNHKCEAYMENKFCVSRQIIQRENHSIELIENYPCNTKEELLFRERHWIDQTECINKSTPILSVEEKRQMKCRQASKYRQIHKEVIKEWNSKYATFPPIQCECGETYTYKHRARHEASLSHRLGTDQVFRQQHEEEKIKRKEEQQERKREYKARWWRENRAKLNIQNP